MFAPSEMPTINSALRQHAHPRSPTGCKSTVHVCVCARMYTCVRVAHSHALAPCLVMSSFSPRQQRLVFVPFPLPPHPLLLWVPHGRAPPQPLRSCPGLLAFWAAWQLVLKTLFPELFFYLKAATTACIDKVTFHDTVQVQ